jgi:cytoplasmic iron level regulating protein YaaA (DUF328/UPF0246 family)
MEVLGVGASLAAEVSRNVTLWQEPAGPAREIYSGVLYDALGFGSVSEGQLALADESVRVVSAAWGLVAPSDRIPAYRLSMGVNLDAGAGAGAGVGVARSVGKVAAAWRKVLDAELAPLAEGGVVVDCRSATYVAAWKPAARLETDWVSVKVLRELNGKRSVVSHNAKHTRGVLARHLLTRTGAQPQCAEELLVAARECPDFLEANLIPGKGNASVLEIVVS